MRRLVSPFLLCCAMMLASLGLTSCDTLDTAFDCESVCSRYRDCYDSNYDVGACRESCRKRAANDPNVRGAADACEAYRRHVVRVRDVQLRRELQQHRALTTRPRSSSVPCTIGRGTEARACKRGSGSPSGAL